MVLGHDSRSFLSVVRSLGRAGVEVSVAWHHRTARPRGRGISPRRTTSLRSRLHDDLWKTRLIKLVRGEKFDLVIPCHDSCLVPLQQHRADLETHGRFYLLSDEAFAVFFDKFRTNELARSVGVRVPVVILTDPGGTRCGRLRVRMPGRAEAPGVVRPGRSRVQARGAQGLWTGRAEGGLRGRRRGWTRSHPGERPRPGGRRRLLMRAGEPLLAFQHVRLHEPPHRGGQLLPDEHAADAGVARRLGAAAQGARLHRRGHGRVQGRPEDRPLGADRGQRAVLGLATRGPGRGGRLPPGPLPDARRGPHRVPEGVPRGGLLPELGGGRRLAILLPPRRPDGPRA